MDLERGLAVLAGVSKNGEPRDTGPPKEHRPGLAPQAGDRIAQQPSGTSSLIANVSARDLWRALRDSFELGCVLTFPVIALGLLMMGIILLVDEVAELGIDLVTGRTGLEVLGTAVVFGSLGWVLLGIAWDLPSGSQIRQGRFDMATRPARVVRALGVVAGAVAILGSLVVLITQPIWPTLALGGMLLLAAAAASVFAVVPLAVLMMWALRRWGHSPRRSGVALLVLLSVWVMGTAFLFGLLMR